MAQFKISRRESRLEVEKLTRFDLHGLSKLRFDKRHASRFQESQVANFRFAEKKQAWQMFNLILETNNNFFSWSST